VPLFQKPPQTPAEFERSKPLGIPPEENTLEGSRVAILPISALMFGKGPREELLEEIALLRKRVAAREAAGPDASDAGLAVLESQLAAREPLSPEEAGFVTRIDTSREV